MRAGTIVLVASLILIIILLIAFMFFLQVRQTAEKQTGEAPQVVTQVVTEEVTEVVTREVTREPLGTQPEQQTVPRTQPEQ